MNVLVSLWRTVPDIGDEEPVARLVVETEMPEFGEPGFSYEEPKVTVSIEAEGDDAAVTALAEAVVAWRDKFLAAPEVRSDGVRSTGVSSIWGEKT